MNDRKSRVLLKANRTAVLFYGLSTLTSFLNFLYYPVLSRMLPVKAYGEVQFIVTILFQISILFLALNIISILLSLTYSDKKAVLSAKITALSSSLNIVTAISTIILVVALSIFHSSFHFENPFAFLAMGISIISTVPFTIGIGLLQGRDRYIQAGVLNASGSGLKLLFSILFVALGFGTTGAIVGIATGQLLAVLFFAFRKDSAFTLAEIGSFTKPDTSILRPDWHLIVSCIWIIVINIIMSADTIAAKLSLSSQEAGEYAGIATLSKIAIFAVSPLMWLVIPSAVSFAKNRKAVIKLVTVAWIFCLLLVAVYVVAGQWIVTIVVGSQYLSMQQLLVIATVAASFLALAAMLNVILIARQLYKYAAIQAGIVAAAFIIVSIICSGLLPLLSTILVAQAISGGVGIGYYSIIRRINHYEDSSGK